MTKFLFILILISSVFLNACTSNEKIVKRLALAEAESQFVVKAQKDANEFITQSDWLRDEYVQFIKQNSEFQVESVQMEGTSLAVAAVSVKTYPTTQRLTLAKIAGSVEASKVRLFNFGNALQLMAKQTGGSAGMEKQSAGVFKFQKKASGDWQLQN